MRKIVLSLIFVAVAGLFSNTHAMNLDAFLYANNSTVDAKVSYLDKIDYGLMEAGIEAAYKSDEYMILSADLGVKSDDFLPGSRYKLGFKAVYEDAEKNSHIDSQLSALCFVLGIEHDLSEKLNPISIPVSFGGEMSISPKPLTWQDGENYFDARANMNFHIMGNAAIIVEYRYLWSDFEDEGYDWDKQDHNLLFGYRLRF